MASSIDWQKSIWQQQEGLGGDNVGFSSASAATGSVSVSIYDMTKLYDSSKQEIVVTQPSTLQRVYLGTSLSLTANGNDGTTNGTVAGLAVETSNLTAFQTGGTAYAFGYADMQVDGKQAYVKSLTLTDLPQSADNTGRTSVSIIIGSNAISELNGSSKDDTVTAKSFGDTGTINLGAGGDLLSFDANVTTTKKKITVDGGAGNDTIAANNNVLTYKLSSVGDGVTRTANETNLVTGFTTTTTNKSTIQLASGRKFSELEVTGYSYGTADLNQFDLSLTEDKSISTKVTTSFTYTTTGSNNLVMNITGDSGNRTAVVYGSTVAGGVVALGAGVTNSANLYIGAKTAGSGAAATTTTNTAVLTFNDKTKIFLGHEESTAAQFGDTSQYVNVKSVRAGKDGSVVIGNLTSSDDAGDSLSAIGAGVAASLCGIGAASDTLVGSGNDSQTKIKTFGTLNVSGADEVQDFVFGSADNSAADQLLFISGLDMSKIKSVGGKLQMGYDEKNYLALDTSKTDTSNGVYVKYLLGLGSKDTLTALIDSAGGKTLTFDSTKATTYIGGVNSATTEGTTLDLGNAQIAFGFDSGNFEGKEAKYQSYGIATISGANTTAGSMINGAANSAEAVVGASAANSFVCGGFGGNFVDTGNDTLTGSGSSDYTTEFFVGKYMGSDTVTNLSTKDKVTFLNTKVSDITALETSGKALVAYMGEDKVVLNSVTGKTSDIKDVTIQFSDVSVKWNGSGWDPVA